MKILSILFAILILSGCGALPWNPQNNAGLTNVHMEGCGEDEGIDGQMFCDIKVIDGKEKTNVAVEVSKDAKGNFKASYTATDVTAFAGQEIRGQVEQAVSETLGKIMPGITDTIMKGIKDMIVPIP